MRQWWFWPLAALLGGGIAYGLIGLHHVLPGDDSLRIRAMQMAPSARDDRPEYGQAIPVTLPHSWRDASLDSDTQWYRATLPLAVAPDRLWAVYLPSLEMSPAVFVNGALVGGEDPAEDPLPRYWSRPVYYLFPSGVLVPGDNTIEVRVAANGQWGRLHSVFLGPDVLLRPYYQFRYHLRVSLLAVTTIACFVISGFMGALTWVRRDSTYASFAAFAAALGAQNGFMLAVDLPVNNATWDWIGYTMFGVLVLTGSLFSFHFLGIRRPRFERMLLLAVLGAPLLLALIMQVDVVAFNAVGSTVWVLAIVLMAAYPTAIMLRSLRDRRGPEVFALAACYCLVFCLALHDWLYTSGIGYRHYGPIVQYAAAPTLLTFGIILMRRFVTALREADSLTQHLEQRVAEKTLEVEQSYARTRAVEQQVLLSRERERIMREVHDGFGGQLIGTLARLDRDDQKDERIAAELEAALNDLRMMIDSLDEADGDVAAALGLFRNRIQPQLESSGLALAWQVQDVPLLPDFGPERLLHLLRIVQEAVTNVLKHAQATRLRIATHADAQYVWVDVEDDGVGLTRSDAMHGGAAGAAIAETTVRRAGRGFKNMQRRAEEAGFTLTFSNTPSGGTCVRIGIPLLAT